MKESDLDRVCKIEKDNFSQYWSRKSFISELQNENSYMIVAKNTDDTILGYAGMYHVLDEGYVYNIAVDFSYRKNGIGTRLVNCLIERSKKLNLKF